MISIDQTAVASALSSLQADLGTEFSWAGWTLTVGTVGQIVGMPIAGRLGDQFGRRRVLLAAVLVFTLASLCCGFTANIGQLIACRFVQGVAGGAFVPSATGVVADHYGRDRDRAVAMFTSVFPIGAMIGPVVGGAIVTVASWREVFLINVPVGLVVLAVAPLVIAESPRGAGERVDGIGIGLLVSTLLAGMYAITRTGTPGSGWVGPATAAGAAAVAVSCGWLLVRHAARHPSPIVPLALLRGRGFAAINAVNLLFGAAALGLAALVPHYAEQRYHLAPVLAGGLLTLRALGIFGSSAVAVALLRRLGPRPLMLAGFGVHSVGLVMLALPPPGVPPEAWLAAAAAVTGLGMGLASPSTNNAGLHLAPEQISAVTGLRGMFRKSGGIIGISVTTAAVSASTDPVGTQAAAFAVLAVVLLAAVPISLRVPSRAGRW